MPQLPRILNLLHCWQFPPSPRSVASIQHFPRTWAGVWVCSPHRMHSKCRVVCFRTYKRTLLLWTVPFPGFNLGVDTENQWAGKKNKKTFIYRQNCQILFAFGFLATVYSERSVLLTGRVFCFVQWNEMTKHINSRMRFVDAFSGDGPSLLHASRF